MCERGREAQEGREGERGEVALASPGGEGERDMTDSPPMSPQQVNIMLLNIVIAVLLDAFMNAASEEDAIMQVTINRVKYEKRTGSLLNFTQQICSKRSASRSLLTQLARWTLCWRNGSQALRVTTTSSERFSRSGM